MKKKTKVKSLKRSHDLFGEVAADPARHRLGLHDTAITGFGG